MNEFQTFVVIWCIICLPLLIICIIDYIYMAIDFIAILIAMSLIFFLERIKIKRKD